MSRRSVRIQVSDMLDMVRKIKSAHIEPDNPIPSGIGKPRIHAQADYLKYLLTQESTTPEHISAVLESLNHNMFSRPHELNDAITGILEDVRVWVESNTVQDDDRLQMPPDDLIPESL